RVPPRLLRRVRPRSRRQQRRRRLPRARGRRFTTVNDARVRIDVLGPIRAHDAEGADLTPSGALQRRLLALLVLRRGHVVRAETAIDVLWPGSLPRDPSGALQNHVSRLRRGLPAALIESVGDGYRLDPSAVEVDAE